MSSICVQCDGEVGIGGACQCAYYEAEKLKARNTELKAEVERLTEENETLRNRIARLDIYESAVRGESDEMR